ncbi:MAG TPA: prolipoprotein diacylglyceryl transferase [Pseudonocardiaceae bacterium]|nr:prolipoprotein diacylglyceryl transferase [Pseudonocardiaceae bacterium]
MLATAPGPIRTSLPSPPFNGFHVGPLDIRVYGLMYVVGITVAYLLTVRRWQARGGDRETVEDVAIWSVPAGIIGGRVYFDITTPADMPHTWWGPFAIWTGGLGIWGGVALAAAVGIWRLRKRGVAVREFLDVVAPSILLAQGIGRIGNYFNQELFGGPSNLPWAIQIAPQYRPAGFTQYSTFQPTFLYELIFDLCWAGLLIWLADQRKVRPPGIFALYVFGYSAFRIFEESLRVDSSEHFLGLRLNFFVASALAIVGLVWFYLTQRGAHRDRIAVVVGNSTDETGR